MRFLIASFLGALLLGTPAGAQPPEKTIEEYAGLGSRQDAFVQSVAADYASFYDQPTKSKILRFFNEKSNPKWVHTDGVLLVDGVLKYRLQHDANPSASVNDEIANIIIKKFGYPPKLQHPKAQPAK